VKSPREKPTTYRVWPSRQPRSETDPEGSIAGAEVDPEGCIGAAEVLAGAADVSERSGLIP
jgi:hypothetical protein